MVSKGGGKRPLGKDEAAAAVAIVRGARRRLVGARRGRAQPSLGLCLRFARAPRSYEAPRPRAAERAWVSLTLLGSFGGGAIGRAAAGALATGSLGVERAGVCVWTTLRLRVCVRAMEWCRRVRETVE